MFNLFRKRKIQHPGTPHHGYTVHPFGTPGIGNLTLDQQTTQPLYSASGAGHYARQSFACVSRAYSLSDLRLIQSGIAPQTGQLVTTGLVNPDLTAAN